MWNNRYFNKYDNNAAKWYKVNNRFLQACIDGDLVKVKECNEDGSVTSLKQKEEECPNNDQALHLAAESGKLQLIEWLLDNDWCSSKPNIHGETALHVASINGHLEVVRCLANSGELSISDSEGNTAVHFASKSSSPLIFDTLLKCGANMEVKNDQGKTAFLLACEAGNLAAVDKLDKLGAEIFLTTRSGDSALSLAAQSGNEDIVQLLLQRGFGSNARAESSLYNETALHLACGHGRLPMVKILIENGADVHAKTWSQETPLHYLCDPEVIKAQQKKFKGAGRLRRTQCCYHGSDFSDRIEIAKCLLNAGAEPFTLDRSGQSVLHKICRKCTCTQVTFLKVFLRQLTLIPDRKSAIINQQTTDVNIRARIHDQFHALSASLYQLTEQGVTCLHLACANTNVTIIKLLLKHGADPNCRTTENSTPLLCAAQTAYTKGKLRKIICHLLKHGAKETLSAENCEGRTVLHYVVGCNTHIPPYEGLHDLMNVNVGIEDPTKIGGILNINHRDDHGKTALYYLIQGGINCDSTFIDMLIKAGADLDMQYTGTSLVEMAIRLSYTSGLKALLQYMVPIPDNILKNNNIYQDDPEATVLLIQAGCHELVAQYFAIAIERQNLPHCSLCLRADPLLASRLYQTVVKHAIDSEDYNAELMETLVDSATQTPKLEQVCVASIRKHLPECMNHLRYSIIPAIKQLTLPKLVLKQFSLDLQN